MPPPNYNEVLAQWRLPGLNAVENTVAKRWYAEKASIYDSVEFNVPIGPLPDFGTEQTEAQRRQAEYLYSSKADIVAKLGTAVTIIEVKDRATKGAMGQLIHYRYWYLQKHPEVTELNLRVIARWSDPGIAETLLAHGFDLELYGEVV